MYSPCLLATVNHHNRLPPYTVVDLCSTTKRLDFNLSVLLWFSKAELACTYIYIYIPIISHWITILVLKSAKIYQYVGMGFSENRPIRPTIPMDCHCFPPTHLASRCCFSGFFLGHWWIVYHGGYAIEEIWYVYE